MITIINKSRIFIVLIYVIYICFDIAYSQTVKEITDYGENPGNIRMFMFAPENVFKPAVVVALHACHGL